MGYTLAVQEFYSTYDLVVEAAGLLFSQTVFAHDVIEELTTAGILHD